MFAPPAAARAVRLPLLETGNPWAVPAPMFAVPSASSSRLGCTVWPWRAAITMAGAAAHRPATGCTPASDA